VSGPSSRTKDAAASAPTTRGRTSRLRSPLTGAVHVAFLLTLSLAMAAFGPVPVASAAAATAATAQEADLADRLISDIVFDGVDGRDLDLVRNNVRLAPGDPFDWDLVQTDVNTLYRLGLFRRVAAEAELQADGTVVIIFGLQVQSPVLEVQVVGNKAVSDQEILSTVRQRRGGPRDDYLIEKAIRDIRDLYIEKGYYLTDVSIDRTLLNDQDTLLFRIIEGPRVRIRQIDFDGNAAFSGKRLRAETKARTHIFILRQGVLDEDILARDRSALVTFYTDRGYLDVRVDSVIDLSPDNREATVTFLIEEGPRYRVGNIRTENAGNPGVPLGLFDDDQIRAMIPLKVGDTYSADLVRRSQDVLQDAWGTAGYHDIRIRPVPLWTGDEPVVDLLLSVSEGRPYLVGMIEVKDNFLTRDKIIRRELELRPGRPLDLRQLRESERRIERLRLFSTTRVTVQDERPDENPGERDILIEVNERNTGSINFGAAVGSDSGVFGEFSIRQDNFDLFDLPETFGELASGRAFRGAGQKFALTIRPGNEIFEYSTSITEPSLFDSDYSLSGGVSYRERRFADYDEERLTGSLSLGRAFGDVWQGAVRLRGENVQLRNIQDDAATELLLDAGPDTLSSLGVSLTRTTVGTIRRPGRGSRLELGLDRVGALGGDYDFWRAEADYTVFLTLAEDFLGRRSILKLNARAGYIFDEDPRVPTYERFYLGGRSFRGFEFRTVAPKGVRIDNGEQADSVGGNWLFFAGAQYEVPIFQENINGVIFIDSGTVTGDPGFDDYRVSVGFGVRLYIPQLGPVPIAFDFGFPIKDVEGDERQVLSFSAELPF
jgi:outer membrane protein insertion porin family